MPKPRKKSAKALQRQAYTAYLRSPKWKAIRAQVIFRDLGQCQASRGGRPCLSRHEIEVHHITYVRFGREALTDLVTVCHECHVHLHNGSCTST